jgi:uncharacterized protein
VLVHFPAPTGGFYDTSDDHEELLTRPRDLQDNAVPSGNSMAATVFLRLAALTGDSRNREAAENGLRAASPFLTEHPFMFGQWLVALELMLAPSREVAIVGAQNDPATAALLAAAREVVGPADVIALKEPQADSPVPLLQGREMVNGRPTAYVCEAFSCRAPVYSADELRATLAR